VSTAGQQGVTEGIEGCSLSIPSPQNVFRQRRACLALGDPKFA
jgi:hypothetical protein